MLFREGMPPRYQPVETWERRPGAATAPLGGCRRREPEKTLLHQVVRERLEPFLATARERSATGRGLPAHVEGDLCRYLDCGILGRGFQDDACRSQLLNQFDTIVAMKEVVNALGDDRPYFIGAADRLEVRRHERIHIAKSPCQDLCYTLPYMSY